MPEKDRSNTKSRFGRRKFIGHVVKADPNIDNESNRPVEKRGLKTTHLNVNVDLDKIPRTQRKKVNIEIEKALPTKINKPLHLKVPWKTLKTEIKKYDKEKEKARETN